MNELNKILELLDKESLTSDEKLFLSDLLKNDSDANKLNEIYFKLKNFMNSKGLIDKELMAEYVLFKNNVCSENWIILVANRIEEQIRKSPETKALFKEMNEEYNDLNLFLSQTIKEQPVQNNTINKTSFYIFKNYNISKYVYASAAMIILYFGLFTFSSFITPDYKNSFADNDFYSTRGRTSELFQRGLDAIERKDFDSAINYLNKDIISNPDDESIFYTHFVLGITYINAAQNSFIGLFKSFKKEEVEKGIASFNKSIILNKSGKFDNLKLDAHYFIGKSFLLIDDIPSAKKHLNIVVNGKGSYFRKADQLLKSI